MEKENIINKVYNYFDNAKEKIILVKTNNYCYSLLSTGLRVKVHNDRIEVIYCNNLLLTISETDTEYKKLFMYLIDKHDVEESQRKENIMSEFLNGREKKTPEPLTSDHLEQFLSMEDKNAK